MTISAFPPGAMLMLGALLVPFVVGRARATLLLGLPVVTLWLV